jgi:hypothetical protein
MGLDSPAEVLEAVGGLWSYGMDWLSLRTPAGDLTRSRWPEDERWSWLRGRSLVNGSIGLARTTGARREASLERIVGGLCGYLSSFAAARDVHSLEDALGVAHPALKAYEEATRTPFSTRVDRKIYQRKWGL